MSKRYRESWIMAERHLGPYLLVDKLTELPTIAVPPAMLH